MDDVGGLVLAAGQGRRFGAPKALAGGGRPWVVRAVRTLLDGGCTRVHVVVGAAADEVEAALGDGGPDVAPDVAPVVVVHADDWRSGMGASLRAGLDSYADRPDVSSVLVHLVDLPDVGADVVARVVRLAAPDALARADYGEGPGHPVLIGRDHWAAAVDASGADTGARSLATGPGVTLVDCSDLATGRDVDRPADLRPDRVGAADA